MTPSPIELLSILLAEGHQEKITETVEAMNPDTTYDEHSPKTPDQTASTPDLQELQGTEEHAKWHYQEVISISKPCKTKYIAEK